MSHTHRLCSDDRVCTCSSLNILTRGTWITPQMVIGGRGEKCVSAHMYVGKYMCSYLYIHSHSYLLDLIGSRQPQVFVRESGKELSHSHG